MAVPEPVAPITLAEVTTLIPRAQSHAGGGFGEDVVVGEFTSSLSLGERPRDVLRRAHEELKSRKRERRSFVTPVLGYEPGLTPESNEDTSNLQQAFASDSRAALKGEDMPNPNRPLKRPIIGEVAPVTAEEMAQVSPKLPVYAENDERFTSIPSPDPTFELPLLNKPERRERVVHRAGFDEDFELTAWSPAPVAPADVAAIPVDVVSNAHSAPTAQVDPSAAAIDMQPPVLRSRQERPEAPATYRATDELPVRRQRNPEPHTSLPDAEFGQWEQRAVQRASRRFERTPITERPENAPEITAGPEQSQAPFASDAPPTRAVPQEPDVPFVVNEAPSIRDEPVVEGWGDELIAESLRRPRRAPQVRTEPSAPQVDVEARGWRGGPIDAPLDPIPGERLRLERRPRGEPIVETPGFSASTEADHLRGADDERIPAHRDEMPDSNLRSERQRPVRRPARQVPVRDQYDYPIAGDGVDARYTELAAEAELDLLASTDVAHEQRWSNVNRACRTCRDFRPAESGDRGWCTNKWAFSHRRMVDADELPCETSIGGWWLPSDDLWLSAVDVSSHSLPTPLLDKWITDRLTASGEMQELQPLRRRKRS